jgi:hypothetical protein
MTDPNYKASAGLIAAIEQICNGAAAYNFMSAAPPNSKIVYSTDLSQNSVYQSGEVPLLSAGTTAP